MNLPISEPGQAALSGSNGGRAEGEAGGEGESPRQPAKFLYPSGSKPLEGYTIKRGVGRGGFGEVYFAASDAGKEVALKLIRRNLDVELRGVRHCLNLKHQNLIDLYDIRTDDLEDQWVVMEYVNGQSLEEAIEAHPNGMPVDLVEWWMRGIAAGVGYLHDHGIVHRDLKPGNIFLDTTSASQGEAGVVKIGDYGLSKFISCSRRSGQTESVGTVHYMAPEIANGRYGREIDTYALGVILYEMLTGRVPFEGESVGEVLMKHLTAEPSLDAIDEPYREIVRRALAKDPEVRLSTVHELVAMLPSSGAAAPPAPAPTPAPADKTAPAPHEKRRRGARYAGYDDDLTNSASVVSKTDVEEPLYAAVRETLGRARASWDEANLPPVVQGMALVLAIVAGIATVEVWGPLGVMAAVFYAMYYVVWALLLRPAARAHNVRRQVRKAPPAGPPAPPAPRPRPWQEVVHEQLKAKPVRERATSLLGGMLTSSLLCVLASAAATTWLLAETANADWQATHLWLSIITTLGCWSVLLTHTLTEARAEDQAPMRAMLLGLGTLVGLAAFGLGDLLSLDLPVSKDFGPAPSQNVLGGTFEGHARLTDSWGQGLSAPGAVVSMVYFALLMAIPRWWRLADYTRKKRLSIGRLAGLMMAAWLLHFVWWYPQPIGLTVTGIVAGAVMLASAWLPPSKRLEIAKGRVVV